MENIYYAENPFVEDNYLTGSEKDVHVYHVVDGKIEMLFVLHLMPYDDNPKGEIECELESMNYDLSKVNLINLFE